MSAPEFWQTPMGKKFYDHTLPELVRQLGRLAALGERALPLVEAMVRPARPSAGAEQDGSPPAPDGAPISAG
jgi:hypothetical protein